MYEIEMNEMSEAFQDCWRAAGTHLNRQVDGGIQAWLRAHPYPPFLEHLSFRLGNQLFFVRIEDVDGRVTGPGNPNGVVTAAAAANGHACILPMTRRLVGDAWVPAEPGWGLLDAATRQHIDPVLLVTAEDIEMTPWELHDMAVQIVRDYLAEQGCRLMSWQGSPDVDPSIWFIGKSKRPEWVVVRSTSFPANRADRPANWSAIAARCAQVSSIGHFASVAMASAEQPFESDSEAAVPLWRGHAMHVNFEGLE
jgi:hypothetical protein